VVTVRGGGNGKVSIAGVACYRPGDRPHLFYKLRVHRHRKGEAKGFTWADYRDLITAVHRELAAPVIGIRSITSQASRQPALSPCVSLPMTRTYGPVRSCSVRSAAPCSSPKPR